MSEHAKFSASASERWLACPGSIPLSVGYPDNTSEYAAEGTLAHRLFEAGVAGVRPPSAWLGEVHEVEGYAFTVDQEMIDAVETALDNVMAMLPLPDNIQAEERLAYHQWLGVPAGDAFGTTDLVALDGTTLHVHDYKHGKGVPVDAEGNTQLMLYAGGALSVWEAVADITDVCMAIHQPRIRDEPSTWTIPVAELRTWLNGRARSGAISVVNAEKLAGPKGTALTQEWEDTFLHPGGHCRWCPAKNECNARANQAFTTVYEVAPATAAEFDDLTAPAPAPASLLDPAIFGKLVGKLDAIEAWCKDARAHALTLAQDGKLPGWKVVQGKKGNRAWTDKDEAEALLKGTFKLKVEDAYDLSLISPTKAEKLAKAGTIGPRQWKKAQTLITQSEGKPHLAPDDDPRLPLAPAADDFEVLTDASDIC